jgi:dephospho-CoA kinase
VLRIGLTGGIACGKSRVLGRLRTHAFHTLDLDLVAHRVSGAGGKALPAIVAAFGPEVLRPEGGLDREKMGAIVFGDARARATLNAIVHPLVREEEARWAARFTQDPTAVLVTDGALLVEAGFQVRFDRLVVVHCDPEVQLRRLVARDALSEEEAGARINAQMPLGEKRRFAHYEVDTSGTLDDTDAAADRLAEALAALRLPSPLDLPSERVVGCLVHGPRTGPRGLTQGLVLREIAAGRGLELERLLKLLVPPRPGPWYRASDDDAVPPETLAGPLVAWSLARSGADADFLAAAAASLARLTHRDARELAEACFFALALQEAAVAGLGAVVESRLREMELLSARWGGATPAGRTRKAWEAAAAHPRDPLAAREAGRAAGIEPGLAGALAGIVVGSREPPPDDLADAVSVLRGLRAPRSRA